MMAIENMAMNVNPFKDDGPAKTVARSQKIGYKPYEIDQRVQKALSIYDSIGFDQELILKDFVRLTLYTEPLSPYLIDHLLQVIKANNADERVSHRYTGYYLSELISKSFRAGYNDFTFHTDDCKIPNLPIHMRYLDRFPLRYSFFGTAIGPCDIIRCFATHHGDMAGEYSYYNCVGCNITIFGSIEGTLGAHSYGCILRTDREETYEKMAKEALFVGSDNLVQLIDPGRTTVLEEKR